MTGGQEGLEGMLSIFSGVNKGVVPVHNDPYGDLFKAVRHSHVGDSKGELRCVLSLLVSLSERFSTRPLRAGCVFLKTYFLNCR